MNISRLETPHRRLLIAATLVFSLTGQSAFAQDNPGKREENPERLERRAPALERGQQPRVIERERVEVIERREREAGDRPSPEAQRRGQPRPPEAVEMERRLQLRGQAERLRREGHGEEAERIEREINRPRKHAGVEHPERREMRPGQGEIEEMHRRMHHLNVAAENLRAAGQREAAESVAKQAREIEAQIHARAAAERRGQEASPRREGPGADELQALRKENLELRRRLEELNRERR